MDTFSLVLTWLVVFVIALAWFSIILVPLLFATFILLAAPTYFVWSVSALLPAIRGKKVRILMVDDQPSSLVVLEHIFKNKKINYKIVLSGWEAIREMRKEYYDLIVLDHEMPEISGPETLILADRYGNEAKDGNTLKGYRSVPVLGYSTAKIPEWSLPKMQRFRFDSCLSKSTSYKRLERHIDAILPEQKWGA